MSDQHPNEALSRELHELLQSLMRSDLPAEKLEELLRGVRDANTLVREYSSEIQHAAVSKGTAGEDWHWDEEHLKQVPPQNRQEFLISP